MKPLFFTKEHKDYAFQHDFEYDELGLSCVASKNTFGVYIDKEGRVGWRYFSNINEWKYMS